MRNKIVYSIFFLVGLFILATIFSGLIRISYFGDGGLGDSGNVAIIPIKGVISADSGTSLFGSSSMSSDDIIDLIKKANSDPLVEAVVFEIDSPGGAAVPSYELVTAIKRLNKTKIAWIRGLGASGAYWVATATDKSYANPLSTVGSIGVISSYLDFSGLLNDYNVSYERLVAGKYKDMGTPYRSLTDEERDMLQVHLDKVHDFFMDDVSENTGISKEKLAEIAQGQVFLGMEAKELGLIDEIGSLDEIKNYLEDELNSTISFRYPRTSSGFGSLFGLSSDEFAFFLGRGMAYQIGVEDNSPLEILKLQ